MRSSSSVLAERSSCQFSRSSMFDRVNLSMRHAYTRRAEAIVGRAHTHKVFQTRMQKNFILDTNVLLHDPRSIYSFEDNNVIIPIYVIEEIDQFKRDLSELGRNARLVARYLDAFRAEGSLAEGVPLPNGGMLRVSFTNRELPRAMAEKNLTDNRILAVAIDIMEKEPSHEAVFITKDTNLRSRADAMGLVAEDYDTERVEISELYTGHTELVVPSELVDHMYKAGAEVEPPRSDGLAPNQFVLLKDA